jgi:hypothetical protein
LRNSAALAAGLAIPQTNSRKTEIIARPLLDLTCFPHFVHTLPIPQVIKPAGTRPIHRPNRRALANELGSKNTVQVLPGTVTRIISKFEGYPGRYVWRCHPRARRQRNDAPLRHRRSLSDRLLKQSHC